MARVVRRGEGVGMRRYLVLDWSWLSFLWMIMGGVSGGVVAHDSVGRSGPLSYSLSFGGITPIMWEMAWATVWIRSGQAPREFLACAMERGTSRLGFLALFLFSLGLCARLQHHGVVRMGLQGHRPCTVGSCLRVYGLNPVHPVPLQKIQNPLLPTVTPSYSEPPIKMVVE
ncbi:hypothetical protein QBC33DRAFT_527301 [Phialemonium atrogriseum]|uniref:Uncharacterized protein n=1 Tax=Phialemonium atrogriseum TaxID=1093897 RepID=A0AAJ0C775_9PEZI|nr:uncharacterized protein QBC33DRAFT_527301 [Phialemonium atrogriseum]KAK1771235.1 hypothetical protein QBC33DRAFT_527301 [Phialemonium atrogriseum]